MALPWKFSLCTLILNFLLILPSFVAAEENSGILSGHIESLRRATPFVAVYQKYISPRKQGGDFAFDKEWIISINGRCSKIQTKVTAGEGGGRKEAPSKAYNLDGIEYFNPTIGDLYISHLDLSQIGDLSKAKPVNQTAQKNIFLDNGELSDLSLSSSNYEEIENPMISQFDFMMAANLLKRNRVLSKKAPIFARWIDLWNEPRLKGLFFLLDKSSAPAADSALKLDIATLIGKTENPKPEGPCPTWTAVLRRDPRIHSPKPFILSESLIESPWMFDAQKFAHDEKNVVIKTTYEYENEVNGAKISAVIPTKVTQVWLTPTGVIPMSETRLISFAVDSPASRVDTHLDPERAKRILDVDSNTEIEK